LSLIRPVCSHCLRAKKACICHCLQAVNNRVTIGIFQHTLERLQTKGTARLCSLSLAKSVLWSGEALEQAQLEMVKPITQDNMSLFEWLQNKPTYLLYPPTEEGGSNEIVTAECLANQLVSQPNPLNEYANFQVLVLDGTWKKTHKLLMLNPILQTLPRVTIVPTSTSNYSIRKQKNQASLSTIEAVAELLDVLEPGIEAKRRLDKSFAIMQDFLLSLRS